MTHEVATADLLISLVSNGVEDHGRLRAMVLNDICIFEGRRDRSATASLGLIYHGYRDQIVAGASGNDPV